MGQRDSRNQEICLKTRPSASVANHLTKYSKRERKIYKNFNA